MNTLHSPKYQELISKLIKARKDAGLTQVKVAEKLKKPQSYVSKIETMQRRLDVLETAELAKLYKIKVDELL